VFVCIGVRRKFETDIKKMEQTKIEVSKPILSPTRSLDEGFESDPDRISTDSELTAVDNARIDSSPISIYLDGEGESESDNNADDGKRISNAAATTKTAEQQPAIAQPKSDQSQKQHIYRRMKSKAPAPPKSNSTGGYQTIQPRSQSVDRAIHRSSANNDFNKSSTPSANQNILCSAGRFVRVTVDPKQQYLNYFKNYKSYQNYHTNAAANSNSGSVRLLPIAATGSASNLYKSYHSSSNSNSKSSISNLQQSNSHEPSGLLSLSNLSSSMMPMQYGYSTVKAPKSYMHFGHHHLHQASQQQQQQQQPQSIQQSHHFLASSWTQSMDPRKARK
jgi:hypothetical protein